MATKASVKAALKQYVDPEKAAFYPRFFKTGKGEYGEGDCFLGVTVPNQRKVAKQFKALSSDEVCKLLDDKHHECRLTALLILVEQFRRADKKERKRIFDLYFMKVDRINNWDLVDASAHKIVGPHLEDKSRSFLHNLAKTDHLWKQRIAMIATYHFIQQDDFQDTVKLSRYFLTHEHDLIHKASGWMLREVGKRDKSVLKAFLDRHHKRMPRTMLRYAIERLPDQRRKAYLKAR